MKVLDVGCGLDPQGTHNCDVLVQCDAPNLIEVDGVHLPYPDNFFDKVVSHHVIEHLHYHPEIFFLELLRVTKHIVHLTMPHKLSRSAKSPTHTLYFDTDFWHNLCRKHRLCYRLLLHYSFRSTDTFSFGMGIGKWFRWRGHRLPILTLPNIDLDVMVFKNGDYEKYISNRKALGLKDKFT